ncbi:class I SAM-dependent methyltransferase [Shewanella insulae]|uniref:class I SAM-dependent methyltransferase n=1 Tax=Shewanella insulae TaxID=2681496 RepID=UPI001EFEB4CD|nr:class I SAM-dependent methyltransferase [Shewanella insulae]
MSNYQLSVGTFNKLARQYQDKYMQMPLYEPTYARLSELLGERDRVLELACGPGNIARYLLTRHPKLKYLGTDLAPQMVSLARENNPTAQFEVMDSLAVDSLSEMFDAIVCGFCLPYLNREEAKALIQAMATRVNSGGLLYLSTMEGDYEASKLQTSSSGDQAFIYYHCGEWLSAQLSTAGFELLSCHRQDYPERGDVDLFIIARRR